jgi:alkanesulfonate monooxygenase SsuD/methylene tetrahydromethanopterin reductase-like flavin-dependent oxidoreductase (luciferase family)
VTPALGLRYDLRLPDAARRAPDVYAAAIEQCAWADRLGFRWVVLSEHHAADDGYCPSPIVMAAAIASRTERIRLKISALVLPLHDPVRIAEDLAVLDIVSRGRVTVTVGAGYRPAELAMFGVDPGDRVRRVEDGLDALRRAWSGEPFTCEGRPALVRPRPFQQPHPELVLGGASPGAARRAARLGLPFEPVSADLWDVYAEACRDRGVDPGPGPRRGAPLFVHVAEDPERAWALIAPHAAHEMTSYGQWLAEGAETGPYQPVLDEAAVRASGLYAVLTPDECLDLARGVDALMFHPLMGGLAPEVAWESLELFESKVLPQL